MRVREREEPDHVSETHTCLYVPETRSAKLLASTARRVLTPRTATKRFRPSRPKGLQTPWLRRSVVERAAQRPDPKPLLSHHDDLMPIRDQLVTATFEADVVRSVVSSRGPVVRALSPRGCAQHLDQSLVNRQKPLRAPYTRRPFKDESRRRIATKSQDAQQDHGDRKDNALRLPASRSKAWVRGSAERVVTGGTFAVMSRHY
jgi:hypothetical protein